MQLLVSMNTSKQRRNFLRNSASTAAFLLTQVGCERPAQPHAKRLGYLIIDAGEFNLEEILSGLRRRASERNTVIEAVGHVVAFEDLARLPQHAAQILDARPDVLFATSVDIAKAFMRATRDIPIGFLIWADPIAYELVQNLGTPESNITGVSGGSEAALLLLQRVRQAFPTIRSVAIIADIREVGDIPVSQDSIRALGFERIVQHRCLPQEATQFVNRLAAQGYRAVLFGLSNGFLDEGTAIAMAAIKNRLVVVAEHRAFVKAGFALSYQPVAKDIPEKITSVLDLLIQGTPVRNIPVDTPSEFSLAVNLTTLKKLNLKLSSGFLGLADTVFE
jgi:putative tryptophan/tyrosine transport system substrate-binding protein